MKTNLTASSASFSDGDPIPARFTCDGANVSPALSWSAPPAGTKSFAVTVNDPDAPVNFVHWIIYDLPEEGRGIPEGMSSHAVPEGAREGKNDFGDNGYGGPCPPGSKPHHYIFRVYALDTRVGLQSGATLNQLAAAIKGHVLAEGQLVGTYVRSRGGQSQ